MKAVQHGNNTPGTPRVWKGISKCVNLKQDKTFSQRNKFEISLADIKAPMADVSISSACPSHKDNKGVNDLTG